MVRAPRANFRLGAADHAGLLSVNGNAPGGPRYLARPKAGAAPRVPALSPTLYS